MQKRRTIEKTHHITNASSATPSQPEGPSLTFMIARIPEMLCGIQRHHVEFVYFYLLKVQK